MKKRIVCAVFQIIIMMVVQIMPVYAIPPLNFSPNAPTDLHLMGIINNAQLTWTDNSETETGFKIERKTGHSDYEVITTVAADTTSYTDNSLRSGTSYTYRVYAYNVFGSSGYSNEQTYTTLGAPQVPTDLAATSSVLNVDLTWKDNSDTELKFVIQRKQGEAAFATVAEVEPNTVAYTDHVTTTGIFIYRIYAQNSFGVSGVSNEASVSVSILPPIPGNFQVSMVSETETVLSWNDNSNMETGFKIERQEDGGVFSQIAQVAADETGYADTGLVSGSTYAYRIRAFNSIGNSDYSAVETVILSESSSSTPPGTGTETPGTETTETEIPGTGNTGTGTGTPGESPAEVDLEDVVLRFYVDSVESYVKGAGQSNSQLQSMDTAPMISEGRTLLPIKYVAQPLGAAVNWDATEQKVTVTMGSMILELWIDSNTAKVNGIDQDIDSLNSAVVPVIVPPGRTMLPLRFITENLGCSVDWDPVTREVKITYPCD